MDERVNKKLSYYRDKPYEQYEPIACLLQRTRVGLHKQCIGKTIDCLGYICLADSTGL